MNYLKDHLIPATITIKQALSLLDKQGLIANVLFVTDENNCLKGSVSDGDIRRGLLKEVSINDTVQTVMNPHCKYIKNIIAEAALIESYKKANIFFLPLVDEAMHVVSIINLREYKSILPVEAVMMAGGRGQRLYPLTEKTPKPLLKIGDRPIAEHNIDRLKNFGIQNVHISINYLGEQLIEYFGDGSKKNISISYIKEDKPLGTIGSIKLAEKNFKQETILIMNSDLLTTIDFAEFYNTFIASNADMAVAATSYNVDIPYAVLEVKENNVVQSLKEKPRYTYYSNAGIYLLKKDMLCYIPNDKVFDSTDLMEVLIEKGKKIITFPILGYWLDIGKLDDYKKAQEDIKHINL